MFSVSWVQRNVKTRSWVRSVKMASLSSGDGAGRSDTKRTQIPTISQVMQLLADSSDNSGSGLNLSDIDVGGSSSASDVEGGGIPAPQRLSQHFRQQLLACHLTGASATTRPIGKHRKLGTNWWRCCIQYYKHMTSELAKVLIFCNLKKIHSGLP